MRLNGFMKWIIGLLVLSLVILTGCNSEKTMCETSADCIQHCYSECVNVDWHEANDEECVPESVSGRMPRCVCDDGKCAEFQ